MKVNPSNLSYWRSKAAPIIARVLIECQGKSQAELSSALQDAYPFGPKRHHPYKIWLDEIKVQTGKKLPAHLRAAIGRRAGHPKAVAEPNPDQAELF